MSNKLRYLLRRRINGTAYVYFRDRAGRLTRLPGLEGSAEWRRAYDLCLAQMAGAKAPIAEARIGCLPDSIAAAVEVYIGSTRFAGLRPSTRARVLRHCEAIRQRLGAARLRDLDVDAVDIYSEQIARKQGASVADRHVHVLSSIWRAAKKHPQFGIKKIANPTVEAESHYQVQRAHRPWPLDLQHKFMRTAPANLQLAKLLLHFSVQRGGDCIRMRWADYDGAGLLVRQEKTHGERDAVANYHECPKPLRDALDAAARTADTILTNAYGRPYTSASTLSKAIHRHLVAIGAAKKGERSFVMHGLRKTGACDVLDAGAGVAGLKSVGGWKSDSQALYYARLAEQRPTNKKSVALWDAEIERREREAEVADRRSQIRRVK
jgi:integrase